MKNVFFITGAPGSGSMSITNKLAELLDDNFIVYDFVYTPDTKTNKNTRHLAIDTWLQNTADVDKNICLLGDIHTQEIMAAPATQHLNAVNIFLLYAAEYKRNERLADLSIKIDWDLYGTDRPWLEQKTPNNCYVPRLDLGQNTQRSWNKNINVNTLSTTNLSLDEIASTVYNWIENTSEVLLKFGKV